MIDFNNFLEWAKDRFDGDVVVKGKEILINSIFTEDHKHHLACNPSGGKYHREDGCYRCLKTDRKGTLIGLVMFVDNCTHEEAKDILCGGISIRVLEDQLDAFFKEKEKQEEIKAKVQAKIPGVLISSLPNNSLRHKAESYLKSRKLPIEEFYLGYSDNKDYCNRIIIPYYDAAGELIYYNGRSMAKWGPKYRNPDKELGLSKTDIIYAPKWPKAGSKVLITEGEFDAYTLYLCGFNGMACGGKKLFEKQIQLLKNYKVCLALDNDVSGFGALFEMAKLLVAAQFKDITYVFPPQGFKDWNEMYVALNKEILAVWIQSKEKVYDEWTEITLKI